MSAFEGITGSLLVDTIIDNSPTKLREQSKTNLKAYKKLKEFIIELYWLNEFGQDLPKMSHVNHKDYLPNFIKNKINKK